MMRIEEIGIRKIYDSRGDETIEAGVYANGRLYRSQVPAGKSRGTGEAAVLSFEDAHEVLYGSLRTALIGRKVDSLGQFDAMLCEFDNSKNKQNIGGNLSLGISLAGARALADANGLELWEYLRVKYFLEYDLAKFPAIYSNFINGGVHASNNLNIQEYMAVVRDGSTMDERVGKLIELYRGVGNAIKDENRVTELPLGAEGGYSVSFDSSSEPVVLLQREIRDRGLDDDFGIGIDAAASNFYSGGSYSIDGRKLSSRELTDLYVSFAGLADNFFSIEDPFAESDADAFATMRGMFPDLDIIGDDVTVTSAEAVRKCARAGMVSGVIIKPNQVGTISETCFAINEARNNGLKVIVSHRSGETEDTGIIHIARACYAEGVKIGAPIKERIIKYNELLRLYS